MFHKSTDDGFEPRSSGVEVTTLSTVSQPVPTLYKWAIYCPLPFIFGLFKQTIHFYNK